MLDALLGGTSGSKKQQLDELQKHRLAVNQAAIEAVKEIENKLGPLVQLRELSKNTE